jgi:hypothetical protein
LKALLKVSDHSIPISKKKLKALLQVNERLTDTNNKSLRYAYSKYKGIIAAIQLYDEIISEGGWPECYQKVTVTEVRQIFVSKSVWHAQYIPCFQDISKHEEMVEWLEGSGGSENDDENVWGFKKVAYHFSDLKEWLEEKKKAKGKGKQKMVKKKKTEEKVSKKKKVDSSKIVKEKK